MHIRGTIRLGIVIAAVVMLAACGSGSSDPGSKSTNASGKSDVRVGLAFDIGGRGDKNFNDLAAAALDKAVSELGVETKELAAAQNETETAKEERLDLLASSGYNPVIAVGFAYSGSVGKVAPKYPDTHFAIVDDAVNCTGDSAQPNVVCLTFRHQESAFLVGAAAALVSKTKNVGFIGGVNVPSQQTFQAGYEAGVAAIDPSVKVQAKYLSEPPDFTGFGDPAKAKTTALGMYDAGADVIFHVAGGSGAGLFDAAAERKRLAIGVDADQYQSADPAQREWIYTSALKKVDTATFDFIKSETEGSFKAGEMSFGLDNGGVGYATSNPLIDPFKSQIDELKEKVISGEIKVPTAK